MYVTLVAKTHLGAKVFADAERAWALWAELKRGARGTVAACVMPNHVHEVVVTDNPEAARRSLATRVANYARKGGWGHLWKALPPPEVLPDELHLRRQIRYIHLNPCRAELVRDPLLWPWSTHRGVLGAELDAWVSPEQMAAVFDRNLGGFAEWFHRYVSSDPHAAVGGTPMPTSSASRAIAAVPLDLVVLAARAATPHAGQRTLRRRLTVALARDQGWRDAQLIASALRITDRHVRRLALSPEAELLRLGRLFLGDSRLRFVPWAGRANVREADISGRSVA